ncbi:MAG: histidinol-phosphate transaminase [Deltaproteobacteria bacterium]|nr:histidinol-phosphate transaminase [Deltaproteobacteria bacterium]MCZ6712817.1 histidinol-phosphate transaminase [Deltaproteobacteria bacterium]MCZ6821738.1 histidinol-phosphate transaminase [Deltaproteobacteria bacterium]TDJ01907.1 MAG: histidinol-phosphate transaminase [Deltaproteobacteria bacterium]TDJ08855.1 MAG: histidinol-phosphate transaminase [Deltaproteobacteria bacterium]
MMRITELAKPHIRNLEPYQGGKPIEELERELGIQNAIKLASNECPHPPSERVLQALREALAGVHRYPDGGSFYLRRALAEHLETGVESLFLGAGSDEILEILVKCFLGPGDEAVFAWPSFAMYPIVTQGVGATAVKVPLDPQLVVDVKALVGAVTERTRLLFLSNPNNPTGTSIGAADLAGLLREVPEHVIVVNDEAYLDYVRREDFPDSLACLEDRSTFVTLRTFSKVYGLAGLRLGYAVGDPELVGLLERARHPFNVNLLAQVAGCAALEDPEHVSRIRRMTHAGLDQLECAFDEIGLAYTKSDANFILVKVGSCAAEIHAGLQRAGVITRRMDAFGLQDRLRITVGLPEENKRLIEALRQELGR